MMKKEKPMTCPKYILLLLLTCFSCNERISGPQYEMDMTSNPAGFDNWIHADIYRSHRSGTGAPFTKREAVNLAVPVYSEGAPQGIFHKNGSFDYFVYMHTRTKDPWDDNIRLQNNVDRNCPPGAGRWMTISIH